MAYGKFYSQVINEEEINASFFNKHYREIMLKSLIIVLLCLFFCVKWSSGQQITELPPLHLVKSDSSYFNTNNLIKNQKVIFIYFPYLRSFVKRAA